MSEIEGGFLRVAEDTVEVVLDEELYTADAIFKACYLFTDRCYLFLDRKEKRRIHIYIAPKDDETDVRSLAGDFCNELIDQRVRQLTENEYGKLRELIVAQAFTEGDLLSSVDGPTTSDDYRQDPLKIGDSSD